MNQVLRLPKPVKIITKKGKHCASSVTSGESECNNNSCLCYEYEWTIYSTNDDF